MNKMNCQRKYLPRTYLIIQNHKEFLKFNNKETSNTVKKWAKYLKRLHQRRYTVLYKNMKNVQHHVIKELKIKQQ